MNYQQILLLALGLLVLLFLICYLVNWFQSERALKDLENKEWLNGLAEKDEQGKGERS